ncbi:MAG: methyltransferase domain-containing protein [Balneolaceae bacterium]
MIPLQTRNTGLVEEMDKSSIDQDTLFRTYDQFHGLNRWLTGWKTLFKQRILPLSGIDRPLRILDIGCGGGDLCRNLSEWAKHASIGVDITGIDPDPRAIRYSRSQPLPDNVRFLHCRATDLVHNEETFDVALSNHLLHHLEDFELITLCREAEKLTTGTVLFNDIRRSRTGYLLFGAIAPLLFRNSFIVRDGLTSIRRSFRLDELKKALPKGWDVELLFPWRLLVTWSGRNRTGSTRIKPYGSP